MVLANLVPRVCFVGKNRLRLNKNGPAEDEIEVWMRSQKEKVLRFD